MSVQTPWLAPPENEKEYALHRVRLRQDGICCEPGAATAQRNGQWIEADIVIRASRIERIQIPADRTALPPASIDARGGILLPLFTDPHVHLDKAHTAAFTRFPCTDLPGAVTAMMADRQTWTPQTLERRVEFSLGSAFACGVGAMRSHVDMIARGRDFVWPAMKAAATRWKGRIDLQLCPLASIDYFTSPEHVAQMVEYARHSGVLGVFIYDQADLAQRLPEVFALAQAHGFDLDFHVDEGLDERLDGLNALLDALETSAFSGQVLCGHCSALSIYDDTRREALIARAANANAHFVALPTTNLYLQDRNRARVPRLRGMTAVRRLLAAGAVVSVGADNVRDGFYAYGEFDPLAVLSLAVQLGHLDGDEINPLALITTNPRRSMRLSDNTRIREGIDANFVLLKARDMGELCARPQSDRVVIRQGVWTDTALPDYRNLYGEAIREADDAQANNRLGRL